MDVTSIVADIGKAITSVFNFGKSPDQKNYDNYRTLVWTNFANLVDSVTRATQSGTLDRNGLQLYIDAVSKIMTEYNSQTQSLYLPKIGSSWVMPRFHDYYDPMVATVNAWRNEILTLPLEGIVASVTGSTNMVLPASIVSGMPAGSTPGGVPVQSGNILASITSSPLMILGLALGAVYVLGHMQRER